MTLRIIYTCLLLLLAQSSMAQKQGQQAIDSMLQDLSSPRYRNDDTNKVKLLIRISWTCLDESKDCGMGYGERALELSVRLNWPKGIALANAVIGDAYANKADYKTALSYYDKSLKSAEEAGDKSTMAIAVGNAANVYFQMGDLKTALAKDLKSLELCEEAGKKINIANALNSVGNIYTEQGYYPQALEYHYKALKIYEELGVKINIARSHLNIANILNDEGDYPGALQHYNTALKLDEEIGYSTGVAGCYISIGTVYQNNGELDRSLEYFQKALKIPLGSENSALVGNLAANTGMTYYKQKKYTVAGEYFRASLQIFTNLQDKRDIAIDLVYLGNCYVAMAGDRTKSNTNDVSMPIEPEIKQYLSGFRVPTGKAALLNAATGHFKNALVIARDINSLNILQNSYEGLAKIYELNENYKAALAYADSARTMKDSVFSKENNEKIVQLELKNQYNNQHLADSLKSVQNIQVINFRLQRQRLIFYVSLGLFFVIIAAIVALLRAKMARNKVEQQALFSRQLLETELKALRAQMNPHFIFNCLNSIQAFILREDKAAATAYLQKFSRLIRLILDNTQKSSNNIEDEVEILTLYIELEKLRLKDKFDFEIKITGDADTGFSEVPSMVMQPLVENSIWHGLMHAPAKGLLKVEFSKHGNLLSCIVEDNGIGLAAAKQMRASGGGPHESKGLKMIEARLEAWGSAKGIRTHLNTFDLGNGVATGTRTEITISYNYHD